MKLKNVRGGATLPQLFWNVGSDLEYQVREGELPHRYLHSTHLPVKLYHSPYSILQYAILSN